MTMREYWNEQAAGFDDEADHGLRDASVRDAWRDLLLPRLPEPPAAVLDLGSGTGSLSVLLAGQGYEVSGADLSERMVASARAKAGPSATFVQGDAAHPPFRQGRFDVVLVRHVLWALDDPAAAIAEWVRLLRPGGRLLLIEGRWSTGGGITAADCRALMLRHRAEAQIVRLSDPNLWGQAITDERYLVLSDH